MNNIWIFIKTSLLTRTRDHGIDIFFKHSYSVFLAAAVALAAAFLRCVATNMAQKNPIRLPNSTRICEIICTHVNILALQSYRSKSTNHRRNVGHIDVHHQRQIAPVGLQQRPVQIVQVGQREIVAVALESREEIQRQCLVHWSVRQPLDQEQVKLFGPSGFRHKALDVFVEIVRHCAAKDEPGWIMNLLNVIIDFPL